jgi:hypothetical protein
LIFLGYFRISIKKKSGLEIRKPVKDFLNSSGFILFRYDVDNSDRLINPYFGG